MSERELPTATYRLQLHAGFTFSDARRIVPYLADLGVSHLYLSPILQAAPGSMHGYDVVDHAAVSAELGGRAGLEDLAAHAHEHGLGIVVDVVPNHMAVPAPEHLNRQLWDVLRQGRSSAYASWFDVDWDLCGGRVGLPVLGDTVDAALASGELTLDTVEGEPVIRYHDHVFPVADGTVPAEGEGDLPGLLGRQHYVLASWREKNEVLGYRRFFDVDTLIAVRVEIDEVFDATHALLLDLYAAGVLDGFRIDHPDGLADPEGYLARLGKATDDGWVVVEKILEGDERLPRTWATAGTTGYDAANVISAALTPSTGPRLDAIWRALAGDESLADVELAAKRQVTTTLLSPEVSRLTRLATELSEPHRVRALPGSDRSVREALEELLVHVEVYRAYLRPGTPADPDQVARLDAMVVRAQQSRPDLAEELQRLRVLLVDVETVDATGRDLVTRFQQVCGPVMAKGVEDTTFYRYNRLLALNEVGGDPSVLADPGPERLHAWAAAQQRDFPHGMTSLSTHDTKRSEDVRARLLALAGDSEAWESLWNDVSARAGEHVVDGPTAYLLFQTLLGAWPIDEERLAAYLTKAMREAKRHTTWDDPDPSYEGRVQALARDCLGSERLTRRIAETLAEHEPEIAAVTLAAKLLQLTLPGVPDVYQGCETLALSVVDPDNRRPVDFDALSSRFVRPAQAASLRAQSDESLGEMKWGVTSTALRLRRDRPDLFGADADYRPLPSSPDVLAFVRTHGDDAAATVVHTTGRGLDTGDVTLPAGRWVDALTGQVHDGGRRPTVELLASLPVALLVKEPRR